MKLSVKVPKIEDLVISYNELQSKDVPLDRLVEFVQMSRFDARLFEILVKYFAESYTAINPFEANTQLKKADWSMALGPILSHSRLLVADKHIFDCWSKICLHELKKSNGELFFLGQFDFNPKRIAQIISRPSQLFKEWGYLHDEVVINKAEKLNRTTIPKNQRIRHLKNLMKSNKKIKAEEYRRSLNYQVSIRQAQRDLAES